MENRNIIRFEFTKKDGLKYISHLDLQRAIARIIKRSHIPIRYTQGFNPHPKMVFALTLSVGCESECEMMDVYMEIDESRPNVPLYTPEEFKEAILPNLPKGLDFIRAYYPESKFSDIKSADYEVYMELSEDTNISEKIRSALENPTVVTKKSKAGDKEIDITPMIKKSNIIQEGKKIIMELRLSAEPDSYLNPELLMQGLKAKNVFGNLLSYYTVTRKKILFD